MSVPKGFRFQTVCFVIEGLNSFALVLYNSYLFFYLRARFGFHDRDNLLVAALLGLIYLFVRVARRTVRPAPRLFLRAETRRDW